MNVIIKKIRSNGGTNMKTKIEKSKEISGITLIALVITILFSYDEKLKCSNNKGFLLQTI